jgi:hypothetical protein
MAAIAKVPREDRSGLALMFILIFLAFFARLPLKGHGWAGVAASPMKASVNKNYLYAVYGFYLSKW